MGGPESGVARARSGEAELVLDVEFESHPLQRWQCSAGHDGAPAFPHVVSEGGQLAEGSDVDEGQVRHVEVHGLRAVQVDGVDSEARVVRVSR